MFYVYEHWRPDKSVCFYVGKGRLYRGYPNRAYQMRYGRNRYFKAIVAKLLARGMKVDVRIVFETQSEDEAYAKEIERIEFWRAAGVKLTNLASGGGRNSGWTLSDERRRMVGESKRGNKYRLGAILSAETRAKISAAHIGKTFSEEYKAAMSLAVKGEKNGFFGRSHSDETKKKVAEANRRRVWSEESRRKLSQSLKGRHGLRRASDAARSP